MSGGMEIAKAGWLYRQSSVLKRWKRNWFALYRDGLLRYFESKDSPRAEEVFVLRSVCKSIKTDKELQSTMPPEGMGGGRDCMFELEMRDGNHLLLCGESFDDMRAWQYALEEARTLRDSHSAPPAPGYMAVQPMPYIQNTFSTYQYGMGYPGQVISPGAVGYTQQVVHSPNGTTTFIQPPPQVVVDIDPYYQYRHRRHYRGYGYGYRPLGEFSGQVISRPPQ